MSPDSSPTANTGPVRRDLGYEPKVSIDEGLRRLATSLHPPSP